LKSSKDQFTYSVPNERPALLTEGIGLLHQLKHQYFFAVEWRLSSVRRVDWWLLRVGEMERMSCGTWPKPTSMCKVVLGMRVQWIGNWDYQWQQCHCGLLVPLISGCSYSVVVVLNSNSHNLLLFTSISADLVDQPCVLVQQKLDILVAFTSGALHW